MAVLLYERPGPFIASHPIANATKLITRGKLCRKILRPQFLTRKFFFPSLCVLSKIDEVKGRYLSSYKAEETNKQTKNKKYHLFVYILYIKNTL